MGYEGVETGRFYGRRAADWKAMCADVGLELVALQLYPHTLTEPQLRETIRFCHEAGCPRINTAWFKGSAENANDWQLIVNVLNHAAAVAHRRVSSSATTTTTRSFTYDWTGRRLWSGCTRGWTRA